MATKRITRAELRKLRDSLRDSRRLMSVALPQLERVYGLASSRAILTGTSRGPEFEIRSVVSIPEPRAKQQAKKQKSTRRVVKKRDATRYVPTRILGKRVEAGRQAWEASQKQKREVKKSVTISDLAAQRPVTMTAASAPLRASSLREIGSVVLSTALSFVR